MILPLADTLRLALFRKVGEVPTFVGFGNFALLFGDPRWSSHFWAALLQQPVLLPLPPRCCRTRSASRWQRFFRCRSCVGGRSTGRSFFLPTMLSFVIVGFTWKLILSPIWGVAPTLLGMVGLRSWFHPWLGQESTALTTLALISVWQFVGIPMMLIYAAMLAIPEEVIEAAELDGVTGFAQFWRIKLPLVLPTIGICSILTFVGNFNAFDLIYTAQGALAGPNYATDILGTFLFRTFFGNQLQLGDPNMGATIATMMFLIILVGVSVYLFGVQIPHAALSVLRGTMSDLSRR